MTTVWLYEEILATDRRVFATKAAALEYIQELTEWLHAEIGLDKLVEGEDYLLYELEVEGLPSTREIFG